MRRWPPTSTVSSLSPTPTLVGVSADIPSSPCSAEWLNAQDTDIIATAGRALRTSSLRALLVDSPVTAGTTMSDSIGRRFGIVNPVVLPLHPGYLWQFRILLVEERDHRR